jgi:hypothetical protein
MRRLWATAASGAVLMLSASCSADPPATGTATPAVPPASVAASAPGAPGAPGASAGASGVAPNPGDVALAGNTAAICEQATKVGAQAVTLYGQNKKILADAMTAKDSDLAGKAKAKAQRDMQNWAFALTDLSRLVADTTVKKALAAASTQVTKLRTDIGKINAKDFAAVQAKLDKACGKG